jgi:hypothetical protein
VHGWALLAELLRVRGLSAPRANVLDAARVDSLGELAGHDGIGLAALVDDVIATEALVAKPLSADAANGLIAGARAIESCIT